MQQKQTIVLKSQPEVPLGPKDSGRVINSDENLRKVLWSPDLAQTLKPRTKK